ncbi:hypothetical protein AL520_30105 [Achromobacter xylosoxidans]|nr:hypothetical protein AL520_30105 [Achromobacter xylosoxidans]
MTRTCVFRLDTAFLERQASDLSLALDQAVSRGSFLQSLLDRFSGDIDRVLADVVLGDGVPTTLADGSIEVLYRPRLAAHFEYLISALRTTERNDVFGHESSPNVEEVSVGATDSTLRGNHGGEET